MATTHPNVIPFPARSGKTETSDPNCQLLKAAKATYSALLLAVPAGEANTVIRALGQAIRATENPEPPETPSPAERAKRQPQAAVKLSEAAATQLLREIHSERCVCGLVKESRRPFCRRCYFSLDDKRRAGMWFSGCNESERLLEKVIEARVYLRGIGMLAPLAMRASA